MLRLMIGTDWTANRDAVLSAIQDNVNKKIGKQILLVPDLISHDTERKLCAVVGDESSRYVEVLTFSRLADRVADAFGFLSQECLDDGGRIVAMAAAVRQMHSRLKAYASVESRPEFLSDLVDTIDEFKCCCIMPADVSAAAENAKGVLAQKLEELALIYDAYESICARGKRDPRDRMTWLLEELEDCDFAREHTVFIDGFPDFTRQHMAILEHFIENCPNLTISLTCDKPDSDKIAFEKAGATAHDVLQFAKRANISCRIDAVDTRDGLLADFKSVLFENQATCISHPECLSAFQTETVRQECGVIAQKIRQLVMDGCRYRDISVVCADMPAYKDLLTMSFNKHDIPIYISGTDEILEKNAISAVLCMVETSLNGYNTKDVLRYLKSMLSPISLDICDQLERYAYIWAISGSVWHKEWTMHPRGLGEEWLEADYQQLRQLNEARKTAIAPLEAFRQNFTGSANMAQQTEALYQLFESIDLASKFSALAEEMHAKGQLRSAQIFNQLWDILLCAMEQMHGILFETIWDAETFTQLFKLLLSKYDVGTIPPVLDAVVVGPVSAMRCQEVKYLFVIGALEGKIPVYSGSIGVLSDADRQILRNIGLPVNDSGVVGLQAEFAEIYGVFCGAQSFVCISCPDGQPSFLHRRISALTGDREVVNVCDDSLMSDPKSVSAFLSRFDAEKEANALGIGEFYRQFDKHKAHTLGNVDPANIRALYGTSLNLSASQVDRHAECRLSYFLRYGIRAKEWTPAEINPAEFGTYVHAVLENTVKEIMELGGFGEVSAVQAKEIAHKYSDQYAKERFEQISNDRLTYLFNRNVAELDAIVLELWDELRNSLFEPYAFELSFGKNGEMPSVQIPGADFKASLNGYVDRVDVYRDGDNQYFRVVDYKTGKKSFDYCDVFNGIGLQMLLYMFALEQEGTDVLHGESIPAGVLYFPARVPYESADTLLSDEEAEKVRSATWKRKGLLLSNDEILHAMDVEDSFKRLCVSRKKDGGLSGDLASTQQFAILREYVFTYLRKMVNEIASGVVKPNPYMRGSSFDACRYCPYVLVCHPEQVEDRRNYKTVSAQKFWDDISNEVSDNG